MNFPTDGIGGLSGRELTEGNTKKDRSREEDIFPNFAYDPDPRS